MTRNEIKRWSQISNRVGGSLALSLQKGKTSRAGIKKFAKMLMEVAEEMEHASRDRTGASGDG